MKRNGIPQKKNKILEIGQLKVAVQGLVDFLYLEDKISVHTKFFCSQRAKIQHGKRALQYEGREQGAINVAS